ncbi:MAG: methyltransferase domain-containing protein [Verrucomicrobiales bacterium]
MKRKSYTGVINIIRFNWHHFAIAFVVAASLLIGSHWIPESLRVFTYSAVGVIFLTVGISLGVSHFIYDRSELNTFKWLHNYLNKDEKQIANFHAGFDESSEFIQAEFPESVLKVFDFFNADSHSEISIRRARKYSSKFEGTISIHSEKVPLAENSMDNALVILAAHELRKPEDRVHFLKEIHRITHINGSVIVVEHLRDFSNFTAFTFGAFHFFSKKEWLRNFSQAGLKLQSERKLTPFISIFHLKIMK